MNNYTGMNVKGYHYSCQAQHIVLAMTMSVWGASALADEAQQSVDSGVGVEIGALTILGPDLRLFYHLPDTPYVIGARYLDYADDFINEAAVGLPGDESDRQYTKRAGLYVNYLLNDDYFSSYYLSGALYSTTLRLECGAESASDSGTGLYFGGGYQGSWSDTFGYNIGILFSPFVRAEPNTPSCSIETNGDMDVNASISFRF